MRTGRIVIQLPQLQGLPPAAVSVQLWVKHQGCEAQLNGTVAYDVAASNKDRIRCADQLNLFLSECQNMTLRRQVGHAM